MRMDKTTECNYITPCGWCEKWNKKCDLKVEEENKNVKPVIQDKNKCTYYNLGYCMGTKERETCELNLVNIFYCDKYKENLY